MVTTRRPTARRRGDVFSASSRNRVDRVAPHLGEERLDRLDAFVVQPVDAPGALRLLHHEPRFLQQAQVARHRGPADRQRVGDLADRPPPGAEQLDDGAPVRDPPAPRTDRRAARGSRVVGAHPVVAGVVLDLGQAETLHHRRHVVGEPTRAAPS